VLEGNGGALPKDRSTGSKRRKSRWETLRIYPAHILAYIFRTTKSVIAIIRMVISPTGGLGPCIARQESGAIDLPDRPGVLLAFSFFPWSLSSAVCQPGWWP